MSDTDVFISSTIKTAWNTGFNAHICALLEEKGFKCFLPQRDVDPRGAGAIFDQNIAAIKRASMVLTVAPHGTVSLGVEAGYAYGINKPLLIVTAPGERVPSMLGGMKANFFEMDSIEEPERFTEELASVIASLVAQGGAAADRKAGPAQQAESHTKQRHST